MAYSIPENMEMQVPGFRSLALNFAQTRSTSREEVRPHAHRHGGGPIDMTWWFFSASMMLPGGVRT